LRSHFNSFAARRDKFRKRGRYFHAELESYLKFIIPSNKEVLEIGSGTGETLAALNPKTGVGIDISEEMVRIASEKFKEKKHLIFNVDNGENPAIDKVFDIIYMQNTIGYFSDIQEALSNIEKNLKSDGRLVITYFNFLWKPLLLLAEKLGLRMPGREKHWLPISDIINLLNLSGFEVVKEENRTIIPFYIPIMSFLFNKILVQLPIFKSLAISTIVVARKKQRRKQGHASVSVVIPCRNEKGNIESAIQRLPKMGSHTEIIYVEGNSSDGTYDECVRVQNKYTEMDIKVFQQDGKGKGDAVRKGFDKATGDILMILDADLTVPPEDLPKFYGAIISNKGDFVNGSRLVYNMESEAMRPLNLLGNKFFSIAFTFLLSQRLRDTLCGTKVIWKKDYQNLINQRSYFGDFDPFGDFDLLFGASKLNLKIVEVPIRYRNREYGETQISRFSHGWLLLKMTFFAMRKIKFI